MNKILLIIKREYLTRVKKKSFIIMSILGPVLMAAIIVIPMFLASLDGDEVKSIAIHDESGKFKNGFESNKRLRFVVFNEQSVKNLKKSFLKDNYYALLIIPKNPEVKDIELISDKQPDISTKMYISNIIEKKLRSDNLKKLGIDEKKLDSINPNIHIQTIKINSDGSEELSSTEVAIAIGYISGFLIYMFIFIYGAMVMRGVIEEKTSRVVEIIISSVKPFQLMMGKIVGIALVALTQFALWAFLTFAIITAVQSTMGINLSSQKSLPISEQVIQSSQSPQDIQNVADNQIFNEIFTSIINLPLALIIFSFIFYFVGGYLLYASLFAAIGGAVDNEADTQQFMLPLTIPLILSLIVAQSIIQNPEGPVAFWFSIIPFTAPVVMMFRIPYGVPVWELLLSMILLVLTFIGTTWMAGKIYRIGILMYGKKFSYKDLWGWLRFKG